MKENWQVIVWDLHLDYRADPIKIWWTLITIYHQYQAHSQNMLKWWVLVLIFRAKSIVLVSMPVTKPNLLRHPPVSAHINILKKRRRWLWTIQLFLQRIKNLVKKTIFSNTILKWTIIWEKLLKKDHIWYNLRSLMMSVEFNRQKEWISSQSFNMVSKTSLMLVLAK